MNRRKTSADEIRSIVGLENGDGLARNPIERTAINQDGHTHGLPNNTAQTILIGHSHRERPTISYHVVNQVTG
jgi:hypothetical protein